MTIKIVNTLAYCFISTLVYLFFNYLAEMLYLSLVFKVMFVGFVVLGSLSAILGVFGKISGKAANILNSVLMGLGFAAAFILLIIRVYNLGMFLEFNFLKHIVLVNMGGITVLAFYLQYVASGFYLSTIGEKKYG